jgi:putative flippase GtrA
VDRRCYGRAVGVADETTVAVPGRLPVAQFARFLVVGLGNTAISFIVYRVLLVLHVPYAVSAPLAFSAGAVNGYIFNRRWTFAARDTRRARWIYMITASVGALATSLCVTLCVLAGVDRVWAYLAAVAPVTVATFLMNRLLVFVDRD